MKVFVFYHGRGSRRPRRSLGARFRPRGGRWQAYLNIMVNSGEQTRTHFLFFRTEQEGASCCLRRDALLKT